MRQGQQENFARIEQAMEEELPELGRGVAFFSSRRWACGGRLQCRCCCPTGYIKGCAPMSQGYQSRFTPQEVYRTTARPRSAEIPAASG